MSNLLQRLRCGECGEPEPDVTRCLRCVAADEISRLSSENKCTSTENMFLREVIDSIAGGHSEDPQFDALKVKAALEPVSEGLATCEHPGITRKWHCTECDDEITDTDKYRDPA